MIAADPSAKAWRERPIDPSVAMPSRPCPINRVNVRAKRLTRVVLHHKSGNGEQKECAEARLTRVVARYIANLTPDWRFPWKFARYIGASGSRAAPTGHARDERADAR
jgi:hypothetical protein